MQLTREPGNQSSADLEQFEAMQNVFEQSAGSFPDKIDAFAKFASRQAIAKFLVRYEIFKRILHINGSIVECGVLHGGGVLGFAKLSSILEPANHVPVWTGTALPSRRVRPHLLAPDVRFPVSVPGGGDPFRDWGEGSGTWPRAVARPTSR